MRRMKVLHVIATLPVGGVENQLLTLLRHYDRDRVEPLVCTLAEPGPVAAEIEAAGVRVVSLRGFGHRFSLPLVRSLARLMREEGVNVVRTHQYHPNLYGRIAARIAGVPCVVASVHNLYTRDRKPHRRMLNNILAGISDRIVAVSESVRADVTRYDRIAPEKVVVIGNGIEEERFRGGDAEKARSSLGIPPGVPVVGTVGRLTLQKGHRFLIEAMPRILVRHPRSVLCIVGEGPEMAALRGTADGLGIGARVITTGLRRDVPDLLALFDVFAFPSLWEGLPNALIEAMAAARAVVTSDIPPCREVVRHEATGLLVPGKDAPALAAAISGLLDDKSLRQRIGEAARRDISDRFGIATTVRRYTELFEEILSRKERAS